MKEILLFEGDTLLLSARKKTLEAEGYQVTGVLEFEEAHRLMKQSAFDLLIVDTGIAEALEMIASATTPTLLMIDEDSAKSINDLPMGMWAIIRKPVTAKRFTRSVAEAMVRADKFKDVTQQKVLLPLNNGGHLLVSEGQIEKFLKRLVEITAAQTEADRVSLLLHEAKTGRFVLKVEIGETVASCDEDLGKWVANLGKPLVVNSRTEASTQVKEIMYRAGAYSVLSAPLVTREEVIGILNAFKMEKGTRFSSSSLEFLTILTSNAATTIDNANLYRNVEEQRVRLERLLEKTFQAQEDERRMIAVDIHDGVGQQIVGVMYRLQALNQLLSDSRIKEACTEAREVLAILEYAVKELRRILAGLHPHALDERDLVQALQQEVDKFNSETKTACRFRVNGAASRLASSRDVAVYRIVQEALSNINKHADATEAEVQLCFELESISLKISDNGKGFNLEGANNGISLGHLGLLGMKERAEMLGGKLTIKSRPGKGTTVLLALPIKP